MGYTSTAVKRKYNEKTYSQWNLQLRKDVFNEIEKLREQTGLSRAEFLKMLVNEHFKTKL